MSENINFNTQLPLGAITPCVKPENSQVTMSVEWGQRMAKMSGRVQGVSGFGSFSRIGIENHIGLNEFYAGTYIMFPTNFFNHTPLIKIHCKIPASLSLTEFGYESNFWIDTEAGWSYLGILGSDYTKSGFNICMFKPTGLDRNTIGAFQQGRLNKLGNSIYGCPGYDSIDISWHAMGY